MIEVVQKAIQKQILLKWFETTALPYKGGFKTASRGPHVI